MDRNLKRKLAAGAAAGLAVAGGGAAIAASKLTSPKEESQAIVDDAAKQLGIQPSKLSDALKQAIENRIDAAVADGRLTKEQGDALKQRVEAGDFPLFGPPVFGRGGFPHGFGFADLDAAASYLGLSEAELRTQLQSGKSLADVARDRGKSVDGLVQALTDAAKQKLDQAVAAGRLTQAQEDSILADLKQRISDRVNEKGAFFGFGPGFRHFRGGSGLPFAPPQFRSTA
jgi:polyhydroxyalkanoate synthesis regulator phasin